MTYLIKFIFILAFTSLFSITALGKAEANESVIENNSGFVTSIVNKIWHDMGGEREFGKALNSSDSLLDWLIIIVERIGITLLVFVCAWVIGKFVSFLIRKIWIGISNYGSSSTFFLKWAESILPTLSKTAFLSIQAIALIVVTQVWWAESLSWFIGTTGNDLIISIINIAMVIVLSLIFWQAAGMGLQLYIERLDQGESSTIKNQRVRTLLPLAKNALAVLISILAGLVILSELGVSIGPLLAGAGVAGLAVGFGAQTLVKDFINGIFILMEDSVHVGNVVRAAGKSGVVEALTVRTMRLRDLKGTVHFIPFSSVDIIENLSKDFSFALIDIGVGYSQDYDNVVSVLESVAKDLASDPVFSSSILSSLEILGLNELADSAVVIRMRIKTIPMKQWGVRREFLRRIKERFDREGIEIPFPHRTIYINSEKKD